MDTVLIAIALWCGTPNLPMSSAKSNEKIMACREEILSCVQVKWAKVESIVPCFNPKEK